MIKIKGFLHFKIVCRLALKMLIKYPIIFANFNFELIFIAFHIIQFHIKFYVFQFIL